MANYTKQELRELEMARSLARGLQPAPVQPICHCGEPAAVEVNRWPRMAFFCADHLADAQTAFEDVAVRRE